MRPVSRIIIHYQEESNVWVAHCVDFDLVTQAKSREDIPKAFGHVYYGEMLVACENDLEVKFNPTPSFVLDEWERLRDQRDGSVKYSLIPWSEFMPNWFSESKGKFNKMLGLSDSDSMNGSEVNCRSKAA